MTPRALHASEQKSIFVDASVFLITGMQIYVRVLFSRCAKYAWANATKLVIVAWIVCGNNPCSSVIQAYVFSKLIHFQILFASTAMVEEELFMILCL